ncbi:FAD-dependent oxidoreductase [Modestobacter marinus]|uniref:FAD-dependent oxidoreductase n=1 Tax=Modestobacter marinus TaxID=477641 RepID=UPI001C97C636|nr:NAD(P)/FAD-dependent oxidoreductase [Modestobacter marinus]
MSGRVLESVPLPEQLAAVGRDPLRVLVVGAGVAGVTLAQLLRTAGLHPVLVDRRTAGADPGYMLGLMPLVDPALRHLGVEDAYRERSVPVRRYALRDRAGRPVREYPLAGLLAFGDYRGIERGELLAVLAAAGGAVTHGATVTGLAQDGERVRAVLADGIGEETAEFDVAIAADGMHSATRALVLDDGQVTGLDTGWGGWVAWTDSDDAPDRYDECWGAGFLLRTYPVRDRIGVFVGGPRRDTAAGPAAFAARVRGQLRAEDVRLDRALAAVAAGDGTRFWPMTDVRSATWSGGRVGLLGDAAAGFLPTAGIGAGMAIESAAVLGRLLLQATPGSVPEVLRRYEARQRPRVEAAQQNSRVLARMVFRSSRPAAVARDLAARFLSLDRALAPIRRLLDDRPEV